MWELGRRGEKCDVRVWQRDEDSLIWQVLPPVFQIRHIENVMNHMFFTYDNGEQVALYRQVD